MRTRTSKHLLVTAMLCCPLALGACGGVTTFQGKSSFGIVGDLPPPPPKPVAEPEHAKIVGNQIVIDQKIQFAFDSSDILPVSHGVLDDVASVMRQHSKIKRVKVEGHASDEGRGATANLYNKALSDRRAHAVMDYLARSIDRTRLEAEGYGVERPIALNDTEEGREKNRRVEFSIISSE